MGRLLYKSYPSLRYIRVVFPTVRLHGSDNDGRCKTCPFVIEFISRIFYRNTTGSRRAYRSNVLSFQTFRVSQRADTAAASAATFRAHDGQKTRRVTKRTFSFYILMPLIRMCRGYTRGFSQSYSCKDPRAFCRRVHV